MDKVTGSPTCLSAAEAELSGLIDAYRKERGLLPLAKSKSLTLVAKWHAFDLEVNGAAKMKDDQGQPCGFHSWSDRGGDRWTKLCYSADRGAAEKMWAKPREVSGGRYRSSGYENIYYNSDKKKLAPGRVMEFWKDRKDESEVMRQEGAWAVVGLRSMGIGISDHYVVVWFGEEVDRDGEVSVCGADGK